MNTHQPKTYVLSIAISEYPHFPLADLSSVMKDTQELIGVLENDYEIEIPLLCHNINSRKEIKAAFAELQGKTQPDQDSLIVFYSGHGNVKNGIPYWQLKSSNNKEQTWYKCADIFDEILKLDLKHVAVFVNSCYSGDLYSIDGLFNNKYEGEDGKTRILFTSGLKNQEVWIHNPFTKTITETLEKYKNTKEFPLGRIIGRVKSKFAEKDFGSNPRDGYFRKHQGGEFILYPKNRENFYWEKVNDTIEGYGDFMDRFPNGENYEKAEKRQKKLIEEEDDWLEVLEEISNKLNKFKENRKLSAKVKNNLNVIDNKIESIRKDVDTNGGLNDLKEWESVRKFINNPKKSYKEKIRKLNSFIENNDNNVFKEDANKRLHHFKRKEDEENEWNEITQIRKRKTTNINHLRRAFLAFIQSYPHSKHIDEAYKKYNEIILVCKIAKTENIEEKRELIDEYQLSYPKGRYAKDVEDISYEIDIDNVVSEIEEEFKNATQENNLEKLNQLIKKISDFSKDKRSAVKEVYEETQRIIATHKASIKVIFDSVVANDSVAQIKEFIRTYSNDIFALEYVSKLEAKLYEKDHKAFNNAELKTKNKIDFQNYVDDFGIKALRLKKAKQRIIELEFYWSASYKAHYEQYIELYEDRNGLMIEEAKNEVAKFIYEANKQKKYTKVINEESIILCEEYLKKYENHKDKQYFEVEKKWKKLFKAKKANDLFLEIQASSCEEKLILCRTYIEDYASGLHIEQVKDIEELTQTELDSKDALEVAVEQRTIEALVNYKANHQYNHEKVDDYMLFLEKRQLGTEDGYRDYLFKRGENGFNALKAKDGIRYCQIAKSDRIEDIREYLSNRLTDEFLGDGNMRIQELKDLAVVEADFEKVKESEDPNIHTNYLRLHKGKNENYDKYVIEDYDRIQRKISDSSDFKIAKESGKILPLVNYIHEYGEDAIHFDEATKLLRDRRLGFTEKDIDLLKKMDKNSDSLNNFSEQITKSVEKNSEVMAQLLAKIDESGDKNVQALSTLTAQLEQAKAKENNSVNQLTNQIEKARKNNMYMFVIILFIFVSIVLVAYFLNQ